MNTKQNESRIQNDLQICEVPVFLKMYLFTSSFLYCPFSGLRVKELRFPSSYPEKDLKKKANRVYEVQNQQMAPKASRIARRICRHST